MIIGTFNVIDYIHFVCLKFMQFNRRKLTFLVCYSVASEQLWLFNGEVEDSTDGDFFHPINGSEHGSPPSLTTRDKELVSVLELRSKSRARGSNQLPLNPQSVTLPTLYHLWC